MAQQFNLPAGMTTQQIQAALAFVASQAVRQQHRPSGLLPANMIRGVDPNYVYEYREFPKALTPPDVEVKDAKEEASLRVRWKMPLQWQANDPQGAEYIRAYYVEREYPVRMTPPQVIVNDEAEEDAIRAGWRAEYGSAERRLYPLWRFHATKPPVYCKTAREEEALGEGWHDSPGEAAEAAKSKPAASAADELDRAALLDLAAELGIQIDGRTKTPAIRDKVRAAQDRAKEPDAI